MTADSSPPTADAGSVVAELEDVCHAWLEPQIRRIAERSYQPRPKVINDAIWGSIHLYAWEVAILDSDLLQRLRFLRQLGVAHWVYPSAGHSRLEHSLGVLHQMQALLTGLERSSSRADDPLFSDVTAKLLRLAALIHDCGHTVMSHVSEKFIERLPGVSRLPPYIKKKYNARKTPSVSEAFAAVFAESPAFKTLLGLPAVGADFIRDVPDACRMIAGFIVGGPMVPKRAFLSLLMSGATDADKLDYMPRDSKMAGVPTPVDVRRLIEKLRVLDVPRELMPRKYTHWAGVDDTKLKVLVLTTSGARALDELAMGRTVLYQKIYHHHKVRAIEVMVRRTLGGMQPRKLGEWLRLVDDDLLSDVKFSVLRQRTLLKRALVLAAPSEDNDYERQWVELTGPVDGPGDRTKLDVLREKLVTEAMQVAQLLKRKGLLDSGVEELNSQEPDVDRTEPKKYSLDEWAYVGDSGDEIAKPPVASIGQRSEAGKDAARQLIQFFAPEGAVLPVFIAARKLLREAHGITTGPAVYRATRLDPDAIQKAENILLQDGYLTLSDLTNSNEGPRILSHQQDALETFLRVAWPRLADLSAKFGQYQAPNAGSINPVTIASYLRQFETEPRARAALRMVEAITFVDRQDLVNVLQALLVGAPKVTVVSPLGGPGDSSAFISYLMNDVPESLRRRVRELDLALDVDESGEILLWDDLCGLGRHTITVLAQWLGLNDEMLLDERLVDQMTADRIRRFSERSIRIAFAMARPSGLQIIRDFLQRHRLANISLVDGIRTVEERNALFDSVDIVSDHAARADLRAFCQAVGERLLRPKALRAHRPLSDEVIGTRLLGYGNESHLIVFPYNVPTVTLTALWGFGESWQPLFPRRTKPSS